MSARMVMSSAVDSQGRPPVVADVSAVIPLPVLNSPTEPGGVTSYPSQIPQTWWTRGPGRPLPGPNDW